jgi:thiamine-phosphate pyrophosphorylase
MSGQHWSRSWKIYILTDTSFSHGRTHLELARDAIAGGADAVQLRAKGINDLAFYEAARALRDLTRRTNTPFIVNDRVDIALAVDADGIHIGQDDLPAKVIRGITGGKKVLGVSARSVDEAVEAERNGADYVGLGPIYEARATKPNAGEPLGLDLIKAVRKRCKVPIVGIGGIGPQNIAEVLAAGADGVAVISAVVSAPDVTNAVRELKDQIQDKA